MPARDTPIGVFDSGVGGLSVLREIRRALPHEDLIYVADSGHAPYGDQPSEFIEGRASAVVRFLLGAGVKAITVACNTATVVAVEQLRGWCPVPIVAIEPAIKPAAAATRSGVIAVLATSQTLASPSVARLCALHGNGVQILLQPCPGLVEQVERGEPDSAATRTLLENYLQPLIAQGADTLVLGCTHYPFLLKTMRDIVGTNINIIDPASAVARELARRLDNQQLRSTQQRAGNDTLYSSGNLADAQRVIPLLWQHGVTVREFTT
jgi:glutamate racemase